MSTPARYALALLLLPVFVMTVAAWLAWRVLMGTLKLAWLAVVRIPDALAWALRVVILSSVLVGTIYVIGLIVVELMERTP